LPLKVAAACRFLLCVCMYYIQILIKFNCPQLKTFCLAGFLKGLSHAIFGPVYWPVWMRLGLKKNRFWFLNFKGAPLIWGRHFKFLCVSVQTSSEILLISEKDWQLGT
jgi:hypothetical protein